MNLAKCYEAKGFAKRFEHLLTLMSDPKFLAMESVGNEIPFYVCPYMIAHNQQMKKDIANLKIQLMQKNIEVLEIDLYLLSLDILKERNILEKQNELESGIDKSALIQQLQSILDPGKHLKNKIIERIMDSDHNILFITGVAEVFPYIRLHKVLENMPSESHDKPAVFFFPGEYDATSESGSSLRLFGKMDDKHYRAFNIFDCLPSKEGSYAH